MVDDDDDDDFSGFLLSLATSLAALGGTLGLGLSPMTV